MTKTSRIEAEQLERLEWLSIIEASTLVLLICVDMPLKHALGWLVGSKFMGPIHGIAFLAYIWTALQTVAGGGWRARDAVRLFVAPILPFAGYFNLRWLRLKAKSLEDGSA